jgi:serine phosphatase RsbU (regulator of sigma subunit)/SAM-dependent methyltransferase
VGPAGRVVAVERSAEQLAEATDQARADAEENLVDMRQGDAIRLPLADDEWGSFDIAHTRFLLEHVSDPLAVVRSMVRAVRPGGRIVLEDDDHDLLRLWPDPPGLSDLWRAYFLTYAHQGKDPYVGRRLVTLLHQAGAAPSRNRSLFFGSCAGSHDFDAMVDNFVGVLAGARDEIVSLGLSDAASIEAALAAFRDWQQKPDAALWYTTCWAEGIRPERAAASRPRSSSRDRNDGAKYSYPDSTEPAREAGVDAAPNRGPSHDEAALLRFLMGAAAELSSSLELDKVFHEIATGLQPLIDYHLFCIMLWNERTELLEHSFSMKYGRSIPQPGGFALGYGLSGNAAADLRPLRVGNVLEDPRYVRFRHPEVEVRSELAVPLVFKDQLIGVLDLESTEFDYFTEEHEQIVSTLAAHIATALVNARLYEKTLHHEQRMEHDLATAREIQRGLLPESTPNLDRLEIGSAYTPARELGGDFFDYLHYSDGRLAIAVGDVAGKATPAALLGSMAVGLLRGHVVEDPREPAEMLAELNEHMQAVGGDNRFVAMAYAVYDEQANRLEIANAGFPRPLLVRDGEAREIEVTGRPLGMLPGSAYASLALELSAGDVLVFCSDGLIECENDHGEVFGAAFLRARLPRLVSRQAAEIAVRLNRAALEFAGGEDRQADDYTVVVLKIS